MSRPKNSRKTYDGRTVYYKDWEARVCAAADAVNLPDDVRAQVHGAWLRAGWENNEKPFHFVRKAWEMISGEEHPEVDAAERAAG